MSTAMQLLLFRAINFGIATVTVVFGPLIGFGGLKGMAMLLGVSAPQGVDPGMQNHLRAIGVMFFAADAILAWATVAILEGKTAYRVGVAVIVVAGLARTTGWVVDGYPGPLAATFLSIRASLVRQTWYVDQLTRVEVALGRGAF